MHSTRCKNFLSHVGFVVIVGYRDVSLRHKSNTFYAILALCTSLYRTNLRKPVSTERTKHTRKPYVQNLCSKCLLARTGPTCAQTTTPLRNRRRDDGMVQAAFTPSEDVLSTHSHHGFANGRHSLEGYHRRYSPPDSNLANWVSTSVGWTLVFLSVSTWQCHMRDLISLTSTLRHHIRDVRDT